MTAAPSRPGRPSRAAAVVGAPAALARRTPLRVKLVAMLMVLVAVALTAAGLAASNALRDYLLGRVDDQLTASVQGLQEHRWPPGDPERHFGSGPLPSASATYIAFTNPEGRGPAQLLSATTSTQSAPKLPTLTTAVVDRHNGKSFTVPAAGSGADWRVLVTAFPDGSGAVTVATTLNDVEDTLGKLRRVELVVGLVVLAATGVLGYLVVRSSLRPLVTVEKTAEAIAAGDLSQRVPAADERTEVGRLSNSLNSMLSQIETAFDAQSASEAAAKASEDRMRQFVADASHELRTPLTSIRGFAELYRQGAVPEPDLERVMGRIEAEATRMGLLVEDLLLLARMDEQRPLEAAPVDLLQLAADAVHDARAVAPDHTLRLVTGGTTGHPAVVVGDEARLRQVLANLTTNALTHTPAGTSVTIRVTTDADDAVVEVSDDGPGLPPDKAAHVFERFYRTDSARTRAKGGSGLGLSIVSALVAAHGGRIELATGVGRGTTFTVRLPLLRAYAGTPQELPLRSDATPRATEVIEVAAGRGSRNSRGASPSVSAPRPPAAEPAGSAGSARSARSARSGPSPWARP